MVRPAPASPQPVVKSLPVNARCGHDQAPECAFHGCPFCFMEDVEGGGPWVDECASCHDARSRAHAAWLELNPAVACELGDCVHCSVCGLCSLTGRVCRTCTLCSDHNHDAEACMVPSSSAVQVRHSYRDPGTGTWQPSQPASTGPSSTVLDASTVMPRTPPTGELRRRLAELRKVECAVEPGAFCYACGPDADSAATARYQYDQARRAW